MKAKIISFSLILMLCCTAFLCLTGCKSDGSVTVSSTTWYFTEGDTVDLAKDSAGGAITFDVKVNLPKKGNPNEYETKELQDQTIKNLQDANQFSASISTVLDRNGDGVVNSKDGEWNETDKTMTRTANISVYGEQILITYVVAQKTT